MEHPLGSTTGFGGPFTPLDPPLAQELRASMVELLARRGDLQSRSVRYAMLSVPRHLFVSANRSLREAYANRPVPIGFEQTISQPTIVAVMTEALELTGSERVLEIGTGSGYQAAILSALCADVFSIEVVPELADGARRRLARYGYANVRVRTGDGYAGWPEHAPFDRIVLTAAPAHVPQTLLGQLRDGGCLVGPVGPTPLSQTLLRIRRVGEDFATEQLGSVVFVPMEHERGH